MAKIKFNKNNVAFQTRLTESVDEYFTSHNLSKKGDWRLYSKTIILFATFCILYVGTLFSPTWWLGLFLIYPLLGLNISYLGFNVMHDGAHGSYSHSPRLNQWMAFLGGDVMGGSTFLWKVKHNELHHSYTNIEGHDDDIAKYPMFRMSPHQERRWYHKYQHRYAIVLYALLSFHWSVIGDFERLIDGKIFERKLKPKLKDYAMFFAGKLFCFSLFLAIPFMVSDTWWYPLAGFFFMHIATGISLAYVFQMAHVVEGTAFPEPPEMDQWMVHQLATTANFAMDNKFITWSSGGLNYQIEHHLFKEISHVHYPAISKIVRRVCDEFGINYHAFPTFGKALGSHSRYLRSMGEAA